MQKVLRRRVLDQRLIDTASGGVKFLFSEGQPMPTSAGRVWTARMVRYDPAEPEPAPRRTKPPRTHRGILCHVCGEPICDFSEAIRRRTDGGRHVLHCADCVPVPAFLKENAFNSRCCVCGIEVPSRTGLDGPIESGEPDARSQWLCYCWDDAPLGIGREQMLAILEQRAIEHRKRYPGFDVERFMRHAKYRPTRFLSWAVNEPIASSSKVFRKSRKARASFERWARSDD
jgi:hypothetical protein